MQHKIRLKFKKQKTLKYRKVLHLVVLPRGI